MLVKFFPNKSAPCTIFSTAVLQIHHCGSYLDAVCGSIYENCDDGNLTIFEESTQWNVKTNPLLLCFHSSLVAPERFLKIIGYKRSGEELLKVCEFVGNSSVLLHNSPTVELIPC